MDMSTGQAQPLILVIGSRNDFLHAYHNEKELLADDSIGTEPGVFSGALEFFDSNGHRLAGVYDQQWQLLELTPSVGKANLPALLKRVQDTINHLVQSFLKDNPEESAEFGAAKEALAQVTSSGTSAELRKFLENFIVRPADGKKDVDDPLGVPISFAPVGPPNNWWKQVVGH